MTAKQFKEWQARMGWAGAEVAKRLGKSDDTISKYRTQGVPAREATVVSLACMALEAGIRL